MTLRDSDRDQRRAADAGRSVWVAASAGTGKTKVLTDRVLNLLLNETAPSRILCLTFTKAAAAEMENRLNERLSSWAVWGDIELGKDIKAITGASPDPDQLLRARRLFAQVLDTPGGMRILTIHAFCQSVLRRFPLEAGIAPQFEVTDERSAAELMAEARTAILERVRTDPKLADAFATVIAHVQEDRFARLIEAATLERGRLERLVANGLDAYLDRLRSALGVAPDEDEAACRLALTDESAFDAGELRRAAAVLSESSKPSDTRRGAGLAAFLSVDHAARAAGFDDYLSIFLTGERQKRQTLATKELRQNHAWLLPALEAEQERLHAGWQHLSSIVTFAATAALTRLAAGFLDAYAAEKRKRFVLDYDDLILTTRALLARPDVAPWVLFKLDGGIDHILIDEAQDTNPDQWQVVAALAEEFFAGKGARDPGRTVFAVGDAKQSIFGFQRADPREFAAMRRHFADKIAAIDSLLWDDVPLTVSFRSTSAVLDVVDAVFARDEARDGVVLDGVEIRHEPFRRGHAGRVELWPALEPADDEAPAPWERLLPVNVEATPRARLALLIARTIRHWIDTGERLDSADRPICAGDVLVLVRRRGGFVGELLRALKQEGVAVAGTDRMVLTEQLAVMDLMALGRFLLLPEDDLTLATVLKSPLVGLDENQLFALAHGREGSLWSSLHRHRSDWAREAASFLSDLLAQADFMPPFELYAGLLGSSGRRKRLIGRLGYEAEDAIDEFIAQSLAYERTHVPSLQGFLAWLERGAAEVRRDLDPGGRDQVRIMTVHGAKGLEAPIVFLPDTIAVPTQSPELLWPEGRDLMLWAPAEGEDAPLAVSAKTAALRRRDEEYRRLLYVALTRAADRLYVCGWKTKRSGSALSWYDHVEQGMLDLTDHTLTPIAVPPDSAEFDRPGLVHRCEQVVPAKPDRRIAAPPPSSQAALPGFAGRNPPPEPAPPRPLIASAPSGEEPPVRSPLGPDLDRRRYQRGTLIHRLLQSLPDLPSSAREAAARRYLARPAHELEPEMQDAIARETLAVLDHPGFAPLFGPDSRAEVPIVGLIPGPPPRALSARVDRLAVTEDEVLVVDYKTNRPPPRERSQVAPAYVTQLALYRGALERIYPGRRVRTLLLWTDGPSIMEIEPG